MPACHTPRTAAVSALTLWQATFDSRLHQRLPNTHRQVWLRLLWGHCSFLWVLVCTGFCLCPPRICSPVLRKFCNQMPRAVKVRFPGGCPSRCLIPRVGSLLRAWTLWQRKGFSDAIVLQPVGRTRPGSGGASGALLPVDLCHTLYRAGVLQQRRRLLGSPLQACALQETLKHSEAALASWKPTNAGVGSVSLLQWIFLTQESNWGLLHCRHILYQLSYQGSPPVFS